LPKQLFPVTFLTSRDKPNPDIIGKLIAFNYFAKMRIRILLIKYLINAVFAARNI